MTNVHILLADDDSDDRLLFQEALLEVSINAQLTTVNDGVQLMLWLAQEDAILPSALFLDLNMPRKNGLECLAEIRDNPALNSLPVFIFSTGNSFDVDELYNIGAQYYIRKPQHFNHLVKIIEKVIKMPEEKKRIQPPRKEFVLIDK
jgi:CheY-like chemotaxis protein